MTTGASTNTGGNVPKCGTDLTPPCPPPDPLVETRNFVIDELAGPAASPERRCAITAQVDTFLQASLRAAFVLLRASTALPPEDPKRSAAESRNGNGSTLNHA